MQRTKIQGEREFSVGLMTDTGTPLIETFLADDPRRAVTAAEARTGARAISVTLMVLVVGRCKKCRTPILSGDAYYPLGDPGTKQWLCESCKR